MKTRINPIKEEQAEGVNAEIFQDIKSKFGYIPNLFKVYAHNPLLLEANWNKLKAMMMQGKLSRKAKEAIALLVSQDNHCEYCVAAHKMALKSIGVGAEEINTIQNDFDKSDFAPKEKKLIRFARKSNQSPGLVTDGEFSELHEKGASNEEIIEALGVMEVFVSFNKFLDSLNVSLNF